MKRREAASGKRDRTARPGRHAELTAIEIRRRLGTSRRKERERRRARRKSARRATRIRIAAMGESFALRS